jgi:hypothetical protein
MVVPRAAISGPAMATLPPPLLHVGQAWELCSRAPPLPYVLAAASASGPSPAGELLLPFGSPSWSSAADVAAVDDVEDEEGLAPRRLLRLRRVP